MRKVQVRQGVRTVADAMRLFGVQHRRLFYNKAAEAQVLVAWSASCVVLCARGSTHAANFVHDSKVCALGSCSAVHAW